MSKRSSKKNGKSSFFSRPWRQSKLDLDKIIEQADNLIEGNRPAEAIALLEPLVKANPREAELHYYLGYARLMTGDLWGALSGYERARELTRDSNYWLPLASLYLQLGLRLHALYAFRQAIKHNVQTADQMELSQIAGDLEESVADVAASLGLPAPKMEKGLRLLEEGQRALHNGEYRECINLNRQAIRLLGNWPPPHNNLSLALFFNGYPQEAIKTARQVLAHNPDNLQAHSNAIRFLAWSGQVDEARKLWPQLQNIPPADHNERLKKVEAAAVLGEDETVYQLLKPLDQSEEPPIEAAPGDAWQSQLFLAVAEANTGRRKAAQKRLRALKPVVPWASDLLAALQAGQPGPGWASRYPYYHSSELMLRQHLEELMTLLGREENMSSKKFEREVARFAERFPQIVLMGEKLIIEENQPEAGIAILASIGTPAAYAALRNFGLSKIGDDETRMQALFRLVEAGQIPADEKLRVWSRDEWQEVELRQYEISDEPEMFYEPEVAELINKGSNALQQNKEKEAERLLQQAIKLEPRAKEAYNNLGVIYARQDDHDRAKKMYRQAVEIDPFYVFPRANLVLYLLDEGDIEAAEKMLTPLAQGKRFTPQEASYYAYIEARLAIAREQYDAARHSLEMCLELMPDFEPAQDLLERLDLISKMRSGWSRWQEQQQQRDRNRRAKLQTRLTTSKPAVADILPLYAKDVLTAMAREIIRWGGWSGLRKAELVDQIVGELTDDYNLERLVTKLEEEERQALRHVLAEGGALDWEAFEARYGNDLDESPYWQYHPPKSLMGRLRLRGLLAEATVNDQLLIVIPAELRRPLSEILAG